MRSLAVAIAALAFAVSAGPASAGVLTSCDDPASSPAFAPFSDPADYFLAPGGGFEEGTDDWLLNGASVVDGNEPFHLTGAGARSLSLPAGSSATSPPVCVGLAHPTFRYVFRKASGGPLAALRVSAVLPGGVTLPVGTVTGSSAWAPSPITLIAANLVSDAVAFRFTPVAGSWQVDDVLVDPCGSRK